MIYGLYPSAGIQGIGTKIKFDFGKKEGNKFKFDLKSEYDSLQKQIKIEIQNTDLSFVDINKSIMNHLSHNCYVKTLFSFKNNLSYDNTIDSLLFKEDVLYDESSNSKEAKGKESSEEVKLGKKASTRSRRRKFTEELL